MSVIYTEPRFDKSDRRYDKYIREGILRMRQKNRYAD